MNEFNWGEEVSAVQLGEFVKVYTDYRLTIILPAIKSYANSTFTGSSYVLDLLPNSRKLTPVCQKKTLYIVYSPTDEHFGAVHCASAPYKNTKSTHRIVFCHRCISNSMDQCECSKPIPKPLLEGFKTCIFCKMTPCMKSGCTRNCQTCGVKYKYGFNRNNGEGYLN